MNNKILHQIRDFEDLLGFPIERKGVPLELNRPHDELFSYELCQKFYGKNVELNTAINYGNKILSALLREHKNKPTRKNLKYMGNFYSLIGNMYYLLEQYKLSAGYFMKSLSYCREDITPWIEFLFSLRAIGEFELFEKAIFNLKKLYKLWAQAPESELTQKVFYDLIKRLEE